MQYAQARPPMAATSSSWHARPEAHQSSAPQGSVQLVDASLQELLKREGNSKAQVQRVLAAVDFESSTPDAHIAKRTNDRQTIRIVSDDASTFGPSWNRRAIAVIDDEIATAPRR